ncbi:HAMP domain-containing protein [Paenibacillus anaericanus]|uniref:histidine kinase n=1 Tax=Paenibacillus anaericanus TaxID=170367 RepID=A0A3S1K4W0_9BACL|nr:ATP-binding protein [Paenibacillus anaericanus]RUT43943.1 HAMP domain-containing protein [Paenibacillus anaericanus]
MKRGLFGKIKTFFAPRSLRFQLLSRSLFILAALLLLIGSLQYVLMKDFLYRSQSETMISQLRSIPKNLLGTNTPAPEWRDEGGSNTDLPSPDKGNRGPIFFLAGTSLAYISEDGSFTDLTEEYGIPSPRLTDAQYAEILENTRYKDHSNYQVVQDTAGNEQLVVITVVGGPDNRHELIQMGTLTAPIREIALRQLRTFLILSLLALAGGLMLYLPVLRRSLNPLNQMIKTVEAINAGNLNHRFPDTQRQLEIDRLANSFNGMLERLELSFDAEREAKEQMRRFIADASHELRTPLTSIHGFLEVLLRGAVDRPEQLYAALNSMHGESKRMKKLVEDLLMLAKLDRAPELQLTETRLDLLITEMEPSLQILAGERNLQLNISPCSPGMYDSDKIKQVILNLFHNAVQHTDPIDGAITLTLSSHQDRTKLTIKDNGQGISKEHLPHVFERFYRSDSSRTRKHGGAGLGLSITHSIVEAHGGSISVYSEVGEGTTFQVVLPILK